MNDAFTWTEVLVLLVVCMVLLGGIGYMEARRNRSYLEYINEREQRRRDRWRCTCAESDECTCGGAYGAGKPRDQRPVAPAPWRPR